MVDETKLDRMNFGELGETLDGVIKMIDQREAKLSEGEDDPIIDMLMGVAQKIIIRMDAIVRQHGVRNPALLAQWNQQIKTFKKDFEKFEDCLLEEDTLLDVE